jgi:hypothetical protein
LETVLPVCGADAETADIMDKLAGCGHGAVDFACGLK